MQQPANSFTQMPSNPQAPITTDQIQKYLDENKQLILAILDNQNLGKMSECAQYQSQLQKNLLFLAAIADNQPQAPAARQIMPHGGMPQGAHFTPQAPPNYPPGTPFNPQQPRQQLLPFQGHMGMRPGFKNDMHPMHPDALHGGSGPSRLTNNNSVDGRGSKHDKGGTESGAAADDGHRSSAPKQGNRDSEPAPGKI